jgi:hypothetical protein
MLIAQNLCQTCQFQKNAREAKIRTIWSPWFLPLCAKLILADFSMAVRTKKKFKKIYLFVGWGKAFVSLYEYTNNAY